MKRTTSLSVLVAVGGLVLAGCAPADTPGGEASDGPAPAEKLRWAAVTGEPPVSYTDDGGKTVGMDPDLARAIAAEMGADVEVIAESFQNSLLGIDADRLDVVGGASITAERMKKYDMVPYHVGAYGMATSAEGADIPDSLDELCGVTLAINAGDVMIPMFKEKSDACTAAGKEPIVVDEFPDATANGLAVQSGRADAWVGPTIALNYTAKADAGKWKRTGPEWGTTMIGFVTQKGSGLGEKIADAINGLIEDGTYEEIMSSYGLEANMIDEATLNPDVGDGTGN